ncbi:hypothetical protein HU200_010159 [Digitaria exilis]|uniref:NAC domain-containing protein n=1 Tax=Digitaria exilis TaxID=1010633 RepID=A0A835KNQ5_9POAL|nr:hypothetical protein HU200_010159 [Digitaria exilis]CAB3500320.1 unnamed protein product [Digitaria exilis]
MESCVPPGFRFHPTDEELVGYYLRKKVASQKIDLDVIRDVNLYRIEPWDLQEHCKIGYEEQSDRYFFSYKDRKYLTGTRTNRATLTGFWKATGRDKAVRDSKQGGGLIGMRKTLVFYTGRAPNGRKTDWIMHEYRLETDENAAPQARPIYIYSAPHLPFQSVCIASRSFHSYVHLHAAGLAVAAANVRRSRRREQMDEEGWVVCRAFKKRTMHPPRSVAGAWDASYSYYHDPVLAGAAHLKQESPELDAAAAASALLQYSNRLAELPQLESPPLPSQGTQQLALAKGEGDSSATTDWRALDRFVASQLTPGEEHAGHGQGSQSQQEYCGKASLGTHAGDSREDGTDMVALLLLLDGTGVRHDEAGLLGSVADPAFLHVNAARYGSQQEP